MVPYVRHSTALRDEVAPLYENRIGRYVNDPWDARNDYIRVVLDRSPEVSEGFPEPSSEEEVDIRRGSGSLETAGDAASRDADVHELRLVLRRAFRH